MAAPAETDAVASTAPSEPDPASAPVKPLPSQKALPPKVRGTGPLGDVIRLAESGTDEGVLQAYVVNSPHTFNLSADEIIYLNDIGVPSSVVTAMIQRDEVLKGTASAPAPAVTVLPSTSDYAPVAESPAQYPPSMAEMTPTPPPAYPPEAYETAPAPGPGPGPR